MKEAILLAAVLALAPPAFAQSEHGKRTNSKSDEKGATVYKASGKVAKVDASKGTVTVAHGPIESLKWPAMTMAFKVNDRAALEKLRPGDQVEFGFIRSGKDYLITELR